MKIAIYPGSFDPVTLGHVDIITRASKIFDKVLVAVLINPSKNPAFSLEERISFLKKALKDFNNIEISSFDGLLADYAKNKSATAIVRGLRGTSDFEYEFQMSVINRKLNHDLDTVFLASSLQNMCLSSSVVKEIARFNGDISAFVPKCIHDDIRKKLCGGGTN